MNDEEAKETLVNILRTRGRARNSELLEALGGDVDRFTRVREDLIFNDLAEDKKGAGLIWLGPPSPQAPAPSAEPQPVTHPPATDAGTRARGIFISYGRADTTDLATRLEEDLRRRGHRVWIDRAGLEHGRSWEEQIEDAILSHEIFISLLSPHAVRRPDGVCLDEISLARYNNRRIIPAMVIDCRQPLGIYRLNWINFQDWRRPARYDRAFHELLSAIEQNAEVEGVYARIFSCLRPLDFGLEISHWSRDFTGREWLFEQLESWLANGTSRVFFVTGDPGTGKSAILAQLVNRNPRVAAYHFCISTLADSLDPIRFVRSIAAQLATQLPAYRAALNALDLEESAAMDAGASFRRLIAGPLQAERGDTPALIVIDALDEALVFGERNVATLLRDRLNDLPQWVKLVISSREQPEILDMFSAFDPEPIRAGSSQNLDDIQLYLVHRFADPAMAAVLAGEEVDPISLAREIRNRSEGNFLYVTQVMRGIETGRWNPAQPDGFPVGLVGIYQSFFERLFPGGRGFGAVQELLSVIAAAREALSAERLARFAGGDPFDVEQAMQSVAPFFPCRDGKYHVYHKSILDWLVGSTGRHAVFRVNFKGGHQRISTALTADYRAGRTDRFLLAHLPWHLVGAESWSELEHVLTDLQFIAAKCRAGLVFELVRDFEYALESLPEARDERISQRQRSQQNSSYVEDLVAFSRGETASLSSSPPSCTPLDEETIRATNRRLAERPGRVERIRSFAQFLNAEAHRITRFSEHQWYCLQQAWNYADAGPVADAARGLLESGVGERILLKSPPFVPAYNPNPGEIRTCDGHTGAVKGVAVTVGGQRAVSGGEDCQLRVWDITSGECVAVLSGHEAGINAVALSADGRLAISGSEDKTIRVWDLHRMNCRAVLTGHTAAVQAVALRPDGGMAMSGGADRTVRVWDTVSAACLQKLTGHGGEVTCLALAANGRLAVSGSTDRVVRVWDPVNGVCLQLLRSHQQGVRCVALTPDGRRAISGGNDGLLHVWNVETGQSERELLGHTDRLRSTAISADGRLAVSGSGHMDQVIRLWDVDTGHCLRLLPGHTDSVKAVALTADGRLAVSGSGARDRTVKVWNLTDGHCPPLGLGHVGGVWSVSLDPECRFAVTCAGANDRTLKLWDLRSGECRRVFEGHTRAVWTVRLNAEKGIALSGSKDRSLRVWDLMTGECRAALTGHDGDVWSVSLFADGLHALSAGGDGALALWDLESGTRVRVFSGHENEVWSVALLPDHTTAVSGSKDLTVRMWDIASGSCLRVLEGHTKGVWSVAVAPDGRTAFSASLDRTVRVWDLTTGHCRSVLQGQNGILFVACSADGRWLATCGYDKALRVWDLRSGMEVAASPEASAVTAASEIRKCTQLVYGTANGFVVPVNWRGFGEQVPLVTAQAPGRVEGIEEANECRSAVSALCEWCGKRSGVSPAVRQTLKDIRARFFVDSVRSPCLDLPAEAGLEPGLTSACTRCGRPVRFNPFVVR